MLLWWYLVNNHTTMKKLFLLPVLALSTMVGFAQETRTKALKYDFFGPVAGCFGLSYETFYRPSTTWEVDAGFIGLQLGDYFGHDSFGGGYISTGPRFYFKPDVNADVENYSDFKGLYLKPELLLNYFAFKDTYTEYIFDEFGNYYYEDFDVDGSDLSVAVLLCLGNQWVFRDLMVMDLWFGLGYGGNWTDVNTEGLPEINYYDDNAPYKYSHVRFGDSPLLFDGGLSLGFLIK